MIQQFKLAREMEAVVDPVDFTISASDCEPLSVNELLSVCGHTATDRLSQTSLGYSSGQGLPELRSEIARMYGDVDGDQVLVCIPQEAQYLAMRVLLKTGDHIVSMFPAYQPLYEIAASMGCEVSWWKPESGSHVNYTVEGLQRVLRPSTRLVVTNFPHNPTGYTPSPAVLRELVGAIHQTDALILADELFRDLTIDDAPPIPSMIDLSDRAIVLSGMSKSYGLGGLRIGWVVTRDASLLPRLIEYRDYTSQSNSSVSEVLAQLALESRERILSANRERIRSNLRLLNHFGTRWSDEVSVLPPVAGSLCLLQLERLSADDFCRRSLRESRVYAASMSLYDYGDRHVRIGLGREGFESALERIDCLMPTMASAT